MTLSVHSGRSIWYYQDRVARGKGPDMRYYTAAASPKGGEEPGFWAGKAAAQLGMSGLVKAETLKALYEQGVAPNGDKIGRSKYTPETPAIKARIEAKIKAEGPAGTVTPVRVREITNEVMSGVKAQVPFYDMRYSAPKSVSLLHAGYLASAYDARAQGNETQAQIMEAKAEEIMVALRDTARESVAQFERDHLYVRRGHHGNGEGAWHKGAGVIAAVFPQRDSRDHDPQLHAHITVFNAAQRLDGGDGKFTAIDSQTWKRAIPGLSSSADRILAGKLQDLGYRIVPHPKGIAFEIGGVTRKNIEAFSTRRTAVTQYLKAEIEAYRAKHGVAPSARVLQSMKTEAQYATKDAKPEVALPPEQLLARWEEQSAHKETAQLRDIPEAVQAYAAAHPEQAFPGDLTPYFEAAVATVQAKHSTWTRDQLKGGLSDALPPFARGVDAAAFLDELTTRALASPSVLPAPVSPAPDVVDISALGLREDGTSIYSAPAATRYCTAAQRDTEDALVETARAEVAQVMTREQAQDALETTDLTEAQRMVAERVLSSQRMATVVVAAPGAGKTHTMAAVAEAARHRGVSVIGLTASTNAARVMATEGMSRTSNIAKFLGQHEDGTFGRHAPVQPGSILVVDEAGTVDTDQWARIFAVARETGSHVVPVGDPQQHEAVGAGGVFDMIAAELGHYQLAEIMRFDAQWEREACARLREGDKTALIEYRNHGRVYEGTAEEMTAKQVELWLGSYLDGKYFPMMAGSIEGAVELSHAAREKLIELGRVDGNHAVPLADGTEAGEGDVIRARLNTKAIDTGAGQHLANRDVLKIERWIGEGPHRVAVCSRQMDNGAWSAHQFPVPMSYLMANAELGYAGNTLAIQGTTTEVPSTMKLTSGDNLATMLVGLSRSTIENVLCIETDHRNSADPAAGARPAPQLHEAPEKQDDSQDTAESVVSVVMDRTGDEESSSAREVALAAQDYAEGMERLHGLWKTVTREAAWEKYTGVLRERLGEDSFSRCMTDPQSDVLYRLIHSAELSGVDAQGFIARATERDFEGANSIASVIHGRMEKEGLPPMSSVTTYRERTPEIADPEKDRIARELATALDNRVEKLGEITALTGPVWAQASLGPVPSDPLARLEWESKAGKAAAARDLTRWHNSREALGPPPARTDSERLAAHRTASEALGLTHDDTEIRETSDGLLQARVFAYDREKEWAPPDVAAELEITAKAEQIYRSHAALSREEGREEVAAADDAAVTRLASHRETLTAIDDAYKAWDKETAMSRDMAARGQEEMERRGAIPRTEEPPPVTDSRFTTEAEPQEAEAEATALPDVDELLARTQASARALETAAQAMERVQAYRSSETWFESEVDDPDHEYIWSRVDDERTASAFQPGREQIGQAREERETQAQGREAAD